MVSKYPFTLYKPRNILMDHHQSSLSSNQLLCQQIRRSMRAARCELEPAQRAALTDKTLQKMINHRLYRAAKHIACYLPNDGELDLSALMAHALAMGKTLYLPVLSRIHHNHLHFSPYQFGDALVPNQFGILEPVVSARHFVNLKRLDLVFTPLVAFDEKGNRLGMGGGFYDRTFSFLRRRVCWKKPRLIGVAYGFQQVTGLTKNKWDVPLGGVMTERGVEMFRAEENKV